MKTDWTAQLIAKVTDGRLIRESGKCISGFNTDTRTLKPGNVYFALSGENFDGHRFAAKAMESGAAGVVISQECPEILDTGFDAFIIRVSDCLEALQCCARNFRAQHRGFFTAITGSNGKTTTRSMLAHLLGLTSKCFATSGNLNNHIGLPLTILAAPEDAEQIVLEMGMNHAGEIRELCRIAAPDAALLSNIGPAHIGILGSLSNIARAKAEIFEQLPADAPRIAPADTEFTDLLRQIGGKNLKTFGQAENADYRICQIECGMSRVSFKILFKNEEMDCILNMAGRHNAFNATAALAMYHQLGFDINAGAKHLQTFSAVNARMERIERDGINILLDCYNANPGSMKEALHFLAICPAPRIAVLGDMRELGELSPQLHREIGALAAELQLEKLITVGEDAQHMADSAVKAGLPENCVHMLNSHDEAAEVLNRQLITGATVLFKASRGMHFEKIVHKIWPEIAQDLH